MKRFAPHIAVATVVAGGMALALVGAVATASGQSAASGLPTIRLALNGSKSITVSGTTVSGAVNIVSTFTGKGQGTLGWSG